jgi:hypothetical protein
MLCSALALSKLYLANDARIHAIAVKGDLIQGESKRIVTRSQAKANPDRYVMVPANVKILKLLINEANNDIDAEYGKKMATAAAATAYSDSEDEWEDGEDEFAYLSGISDLKWSDNT